VRPEDVRVRDLAPDAANAFEATIEGLEFLGSFWRADLRPVGADGVALTGDFSPNLVRDHALEAGKRLRVALPPERLMVFARG
jgi:iron(III) transport system ATP-binding protein